MLKLFDSSTDIECGVDEVARGCLFGRVYAGAVIFGKELGDEKPPVEIRDSKKMTKKQREKASIWIKKNALHYGLGYCDEKYVDDHNILNAAQRAMHKAIQNLDIEPEALLIDGNRFNNYKHQDGSIIPHKCVIKGDNTFFSIACAAILAKDEHDHYIVELCEKYPDLAKRYLLTSNMGYGSKAHRDGIAKYGISQFHRKTFGICSKSYISEVYS
jgi:ribonuclease HII